MTAWRTLHRRSLAASSVLSVAIATPVAAVLFRVLPRDWPAPALVATIAGAAALVVAGALVFDLVRLRTTAWRLTDDRLELRSGIVFREHRSVPRDRIRSVDLTADPVRRALGLAVVRIGTGEHASGERTTLTLDPLSRHAAEELRGALLHEIGEPHSGDPHGDRPLATLDWSWLRLAPLTVWTVAGGALVAGVAYKPLNALGVDLFEPGVVADLWHWVTTRPWLAVPLLLAANALVGLAGALVVFATTWGGYRLEREPGRLKLSKGLLTTRSLTIQERRLRGVELAEPLLLRLGGGARVKAVTTGLREKEENEADDAGTLTPPMPRELAAQVAGRIIRAGHPVLRPHPAAARTRRLRAAAVWTVLLTAAVAVAIRSVSWPVSWSWLWAVPAFVLPLALWLAADAYRGLGHALGERHLVTRSGSIVRRTVALDREGVVGWTVSESYLQRRLGLITVSATTAAGDGHYDLLDVGTEEGLELAARAVPDLLGPFLTRRVGRPGP
ncbi:PH domain-containing protein [Planomonospora sp. ID67723]|uniref:PH domain-containing protein n=1 Tax=Planomonospora sp. ID67723 TaxID=2738134 RepID=UPI0018C3CA0F|nr:PH domain-containing protein [Planomonospora sp. ID67723]MBG0832036.1 PH domain-containing protein [Planomonospora sp. ID67723]